jgi:hypothetical protein
MVLQKCVGLVKDEPDSCREGRATILDNGNDEVNLKVEEAVDIKEESPEATTFPLINTEPQVRLCVCSCMCACVLEREGRGEACTEVPATSTIHCHKSGHS